MNSRFFDAFRKLEEYCLREEYKGYDPYDGLNSRLFKAIPLVGRIRFCRLIWIQAFKRLPVNLRGLVGIDKEVNPKAMGLFLASYVKLYRLSGNEKYLEKIEYFVAQLLKSATKGYNGICWGYNFDWESRAFFQPRFTPTIVTTVFNADAILDAYEVTGDSELLSVARSACDFILNDLKRSYAEDGSFAFSYSKFDNSVVFNASLLGSRLLARIASLTGEEMLFQEARKSVIYCCRYQKEDGSWPYGKYPFHQWVDSFHTGYNLECIHDYARFSGDDSFNQYVAKGLSYYLANFFGADGKPHYYDNSVYPIDLHCVAQLVVTLHKLGELQANKVLVDKVLNWTVEHMQSPDGYFYYQMNRFYINRIPYMRWTQAWMFAAFSTYLYDEYLQSVQPKTENNENLV
jgi:rhamnogalacturonyl hydrolase YesR